MYKTVDVNLGRNYFQQIDEKSLSWFFLRRSSHYGNYRVTHSGQWPNKIMLSKHMHGQKLNQIQIEQKKALNFSTKI